MTGLLVKDFKLMATQKNFFLVILLIVIGMISFTEDVSFPLGFLTFALSLFTLSTISYDEFDNGYAFFIHFTYYSSGLCAGKILSRIPTGI